MRNAGVLVKHREVLEEKSSFKLNCNYNAEVLVHLEMETQLSRPTSDRYLN